jgi:phosphatidylglycerol---prolipoprotein diacylglyceryl transferase
MIDISNLNPFFLQLGPIQISWHGIMFLPGFLLSYFLVNYQIRKERLLFKKGDVMSMYIFLLIGLMIGSRLGYIIIYNLPYYIEIPGELFAIWHGGMSFHGGLIGAIVSGIIFCKIYEYDFWKLADLVIVTVPLCLAFGRFGNFINGELYGRQTSLPWGVLFPYTSHKPRHPSQLYEAFFEGIVLFGILWLLKDKVKMKGGVLCLFFIFYGLFRFIVEFFREPDKHIGFILGSFTMGQLLCAIMIFTGSIAFIILKNWNRALE